MTPLPVRCGLGTNQRRCWWAYDTRVKEGVHKSRPHPNERDLEDMIAKNDLKELKVITFTNKMHLPFGWLNHKNFMVKQALLGAGRTCVGS